MGFGLYLANGFKILLFKKEAVRAIADDPESKKHSFILTTIFSGLAGLVGFFLGFLISPLVTSIPILATAGTFVLAVLLFALVFLFFIISAGLIHIFAKLLKGNATIFQIYAVLLSLYIPLSLISIVVSILELVPVVGFLISLVFFIYNIILYVFVIRETYQFSTARAVFTFLIPIILFFVLMIVIFGAALLTSL